MAIADKLKWFGVQPTDPEAIFTRYEPPEGATYVFASNSAVGGPTLLYTVPDDTIFYLTSWGISIYPVAAGYGQLYLYTDVGGAYLHLCLLDCAVNVGKSVTGSFPIAVQVPEKYYAQITSQAANVNAYAWLVGYTRSTL